MTTDGTLTGQGDGSRWSIKVLSEPIDHPLAFGAVHNGIIVFKDDEPYLSFQGVAVDRDTGQIQAYALDPMQNTLRVFALTNRTTSDGIRTVDQGLINSPDSVMTEVFSGNEIEGTEKIMQLLETAKFINDQNLPYVIGDIIQSSQNSNSVARTLLEGAGIEYPEELEQMFAPGDGRILLPENWQSRFRFAHLDPDNLTEEQTKELTGLLHSLPEYFEILDPRNVSDQAVTDPRPERRDADSLYFHRSQPEEVKGPKFSSPESSSVLHHDR